MRYVAFGLYVLGLVREARQYETSYYGPPLPPPHVMAFRILLWPLDTVLDLLGDLFERRKQ